jgi:hypothetical protein
MTQVMERPRRKRLFWESRCEIVALIEAGMSPYASATDGRTSASAAFSAGGSSSCGRQPARKTWRFPILRAVASGCSPLPLAWMAGGQPGVAGCVCGGVAAVGKGALAVLLATHGLIHRVPMT